MSGTAARSRFAVELLAWLNRRLVPPGTVVEFATPLFTPGLIDSIRVLELIAWVERAIGRRIPDRDIRMDYFATVDAITARFGEEAGDVDA